MYDGLLSQDECVILKLGKQRDVHCCQHSSNDTYGKNMSGNIKLYNKKQKRTFMNWIAFNHYYFTDLDSISKSGS